MSKSGEGDLILTCSGLFDPVDPEPEAIFSSVTDLRFKMPPPIPLPLGFEPLTGAEVGGKLLPLATGQLRLDSESFLFKIGLVNSPLKSSELFFKMGFG